MTSLRKVGARYGRYEHFTSAPIDSRRIGATAFCVFLATQDFVPKIMNQEQLQKFQDNMLQSHYKPDDVFVHASYDLNLCEWDQRIRAKYISRLLSEVRLAYDLGFSLFNVHLGNSPGKININDSLKSAADMLNEVMSQVSDINITLENSVGSGAQYGGQLQDIYQVIEMSLFKERLGFALNTSHAFSYGYDFRDEGKYEAFMQMVDEVIGLNKLKLLFFNDSKTDFMARTDIHASIGKGRIGLAPFHSFLSDERIRHIPIILETPDPLLWVDEISWLIKTDIPN